MGANIHFPALPESEPKQRRQPFTSEEDALLSKLVFEPDLFTWIDIAKRMPGRAPRQCRDRWVNYLCPQNKNGTWTDSEDALLVDKVQELGTAWSRISKFFDGRSENNVKNRWYTRLRPKDAAIIVEPKPTSKRQRFPSIASMTSSVFGMSED
jgi:hypothetical protein